MRRLAFLIAISIAFGMGYSPCYAQNFVLTEVTGVLLRGGRPVTGATLSGCTNARDSDFNSCNKSFSTTSDSKGRFRFYQETGYPECTICPCVPGVPSACDPQWYVIFQVKTPREKVFVYASQMGNGLVKAEFECDLQKEKVPHTFRDGRSMMEMVCFPHTLVESFVNRDSRK